MAAVAILGASTSGCTTAAPQSPKLMARCTQMYALWVRYCQDFILFQSGQRAQAELALHQCQNGQYESGLQQLERILKRDRIAIPPE